MNLNLFEYELVNVVLKLMFLVLAFMFVVYSFIVFRQVSIMKRTLETNYSSLVTFLGMIDLFMAIGVFLIFLVTL